MPCGPCPRPFAVNVAPQARSRRGIDTCFDFAKLRFATLNTNGLCYPTEARWLQRNWLSLLPRRL